MILLFLSLFAHSAIYANIASIALIASKDKGAFAGCELHYYYYYFITITLITNRLRS